MTLRYRSWMTITAVGIGLALGWGLGTQQIKAQDAKDAKAKVWQGKDGGQEEFELAQAIAKATDPEGPKSTRSTNGRRPSRKATMRTCAKNSICSSIKRRR